MYGCIEEYKVISARIHENKVMKNVKVYHNNIMQNYYTIIKYNS